jgi:hypothetical protein
VGLAALCEYQMFQTDCPGLHVSTMWFLIRRTFGAGRPCSREGSGCGVQAVWQQYVMRSIARKRYIISEPDTLCLVCK